MLILKRFMGGNMAVDYQKEFINCLKNIDYSKRPLTVFQDFLTVASISLTNVVYKSKELENEYFEVINRYKNAEKLAELLTITMLALEEKTRDFLGEIYMKENFANKSIAQVFTPFHLSEFMAEITLESDIEKQIQEKGFIKVSDPCCGSGVMTIAMSEILKRRGYNPQKVMWFQGIDIDVNCCKMTYIQTSLLGLTGEIIHGNAITLEYWKRFITPMTLTNFNVLKEIYYKKTEHKEEIKTEVQKIEQERMQNVERRTIKQLSLLIK